MWRFIDWLFDSSAFMLRGSCGQWDAFTEAIYFWSHVGICIEYVAMASVALFIAWVMGQRQPHQYPQRVIRLGVWPLSIAMGAMMVTCAVGHLLDGAGSFYWPAYRLFALWHLVTFAVGMGSFYFLLKIAVAQFSALTKANSGSTTE